MKLLCLISGGIDSPVAAYRMFKAGHEIDFIYFDGGNFMRRPDSAHDLIVKRAVKHLAHLMGRKVKMFILPHDTMLSESIQHAPRNLQCLLCRRMMYRLAENIAGKFGYKALITGESLGQVASQTLWNLRCEDSSVDIDVIRPLLAFDKEEAINIAKEIGTFDISKEHGCCRLRPDNPRTKGRLYEIEDAEKGLDIAGIKEYAIKNMRILEM